VGQSLIKVAHFATPYYQTSFPGLKDMLLVVLPSQWVMYPPCFECRNLEI